MDRRGLLGYLRRMRAYDLGFGSDPESLTLTPDIDNPLRLLDPVRAGWACGDGPAITAEQWPRGTTTGLPMWHALTVEVPEEYRRQGPDLVAVSFFQGQCQFAEPNPDVLALRHGSPLTTEQTADPFLVQFAESLRHEHPRLRHMVDIIDGEFALIWLTREELAGPRSAPPPDVRLPGRRLIDEDYGPNAWDCYPEDALDVWLGVREGDANVGKPPEEFGGYDPAGNPVENGPFAHGGYRVQAYGEAEDPEQRAWIGWLDEHAGRSHFGGTSFHVQAVPDGLGPHYLEIEEFSHLNFGGGNCQIDLENDVFDWACG